MAVHELVTESVRQKMPLLALGTWKSKAGQVKEAVKVAVAAGYRHIDCAAAYGNEAEVGEALSELVGSTVSREDIFITSKLWNTKHRKDDVRPALLKTLADLRLAYLDLYLIHWPMGFQSGGENMPRLPDGSIAYDTTTHYLETWAAMEGLVREGLVHHIGLSNFNSQQISEVCSHASIAPTVLQCESHPYLTQEPLIAHTASLRILFSAYSSLGSPDRPWAKPDEPSLLQDPRITAIAQSYGKSAAQVLIRFQLQRGVGVVAKSVTPDRIRTNFQVNDFELSAADMETLRSFNRDWRACLPKAVVDGQEVARDRSHPHFPFNIPF